jgi:ribosome-associated translation inhibitor RaiA
MSKIVFQSVQFKASSQLKEFVNEKVTKLFDQDPSIIRADVTLFEGASGNPRNQFCEIQLSVPGDNHFVKKNSENYEKSILDAVATLQKIIRRKKTKKIVRRKADS